MKAGNLTLTEEQNSVFFLLVRTFFSLFWFFGLGWDGFYLRVSSTEDYCVAS